MHRARAHTLAHHESIVSTSELSDDDEQPEGRRKCIWDWPSIGSLPGASDCVTPGERTGGANTGVNTNSHHHHRHHHHHHHHHHHIHGRASAPLNSIVRHRSAALDHRNVVFLEENPHNSTHHRADFLAPQRTALVDADAVIRRSHAEDDGATVVACSNTDEKHAIVGEDENFGSPASNSSSTSNSSESLDTGTTSTSEDDPAPSSPVMKTIVLERVDEAVTVSPLRNRPKASDPVTSSVSSATDAVDSGPNIDSPPSSTPVSRQVSRRASSESSGYYSNSSQPGYYSAARARRVSFASHISHSTANSSGMPLDFDESTMTGIDDEAFLFGSGEVSSTRGSGSGGSLLSDCEEEKAELDDEHRERIRSESDEDADCCSSSTSTTVDNNCDSTTAATTCDSTPPRVTTMRPRLTTFAGHSTNRPVLCASNSIDIVNNNRLLHLPPQHSLRQVQRRLSSPISDSVRQLLLDPDHLNDANQVLLKNHVVKRDLGDYVMVNQYRHKKSESLGHGVTSQVKLAFNEANKHYYAIKILQKLKLQRNRSLMRRSSQGFDPAYREIAVLRKLCHPNIVKLVEVLDDPDDDNMFLVFELLRHGPVISIPTSAPLTEEKARKYFRDVVAGLHYLHGENIVHRDLKPDNMLLGDDGHVRLTDFGLSTSFQSSDNDLVANPYQTPAFVAPECLQAVKALTSGRAMDIWSLGISLYAFVCGTVPFTGDCVDDLHKNICTQKVEFRREGLSHSLRDLILRLLEKDPAKRITMPELIHHQWITKHGRWPLCVNDTTGHIDTTVNSRCHSSMDAAPPVPCMLALSVKSDSVATLSDLLAAAAEKQQQHEHMDENVVSSSCSSSGGSVSSIEEERQSDDEDEQIEFDGVVDDLVFASENLPKRLCSPTLFGRPGAAHSESVTVVVQRQRTSASVSSSTSAGTAAAVTTFAAAAAAARAARKRHCSNCSGSSSSMTINDESSANLPAMVVAENVERLGTDDGGENTRMENFDPTAVPVSALPPNGLMAESTTAPTTVAAAANTHKKNRTVSEFSLSSSSRTDRKNQHACLICKRVITMPVVSV